MNKIILDRLVAHFDYLYPRVYSDKKKKEFACAVKHVMNNIKDDIPYRVGIGGDKYGGVSMTIELVEDIVSNTERQYGNSDRSSDNIKLFYFERL